MLKKSLGLKIVLFFLIVALLPFVVISFLTNLQVRQNTRSILEENLSTLTSEIGTEIERTIFFCYTQVGSLAESNTLKSDEVSVEEKLLKMKRIQDFYKTFEDITLVNLDGVVLASTDYNFRGKWRHKEWFKQAKRGERVVSPVHAILNPFKLVLIYTAPVIGENGRVKAVLASQVNMQRIWEITDRVKIGKTGFVFIIDKKGNLIAFPDKEKLLRKITPNALREKVLIKRTGMMEYMSAEGTGKFCYWRGLEGYKDYKGQGWQIGIIQDSSEVFAIINKIQIQTIIIAVSGIILILALAVILAANILSPIRSLSKTVERISGGDLSAKVIIRRKDEIGDLGNSFNKMTEDLRKTTTSIVNLNKEITEREKAEQNLRESEKKYRYLFENSLDLLICLDPSGNIIDVNNSAAKITGYNKEEIIGKQFSQFVPSQYVPLLLKSLASEFAGKPVPAIEIEIKNKKGKLIPVEFSPGSIPLYEKGNLAGVVVSARDITDRKKAEEELKRYHEHLEDMVDSRTAELKKEITERKQVNKEVRASRQELRNLASHLQSVREEEQIRISKQIHDEFGQQLSGLKMSLSWLIQELPKKSKLLIDEGKSMLGKVDSSIQKARTIAMDLRPTVLDDFGIVAAIESHAREFEKGTGIKCRLSFSAEDINLDKDRSTTIFRVFQEAMTNIVRYANASKVKINLKENHKSLMLKIKDNGKGITVKQISSRNALGLVSMKERALFWGGDLKIKGDRGKGTTLTLSIPKKGDD